MTKGFSGAPRDFFKKVLEFPIPLFDSEDADHLRLAKLAREAEKKTREFQNATPPPNPITPHLIGSYRNKVREAIAGELSEIDGIVAKIFGV